jgi:hypothetical protein
MARRRRSTTKVVEFDFSGIGKRFSENERYLVKVAEFEPDENRLRVVFEGTGDYEGAKLWGNYATEGNGAAYTIPLLEALGVEMEVGQKLKLPVGDILGNWLWVTTMGDEYEGRPRVKPVDYAPASDDEVEAAEDGEHPGIVEDKKPKRGRKAKPKEDDDEIPFEDDDEEEKPVRSRRRKAKPKEDEPEEDEEEEEKPTRSRRRKAKPKEDDEGEDEDDEEEEKPTRSRRGRRAKPKDDEPEEKPTRSRRKRKPKVPEVEEASDLAALDQEQLEAVLEEHDCMPEDWEDYKTLKQMRRAATDALEKAGVIED